MRFLHLADVHLDTSFATRSEAVRRRLRGASRDALRAAVDLAIREEVDAFLVAGDLFDGDRLSFRTERFLLEQAARLESHGVTMVYATGNHDPGGATGGPGRLRWPSGTRVVGDTIPQRIRIDDRTGAAVGYVTAVGHADERERDDLSRLLPRPDGELPEVALLHTQVHRSEGAERHHAYAPSELGYLTRAGYDYWALGHVHQRQVLSQDPPVAYPGSLQGKSHAEDGARGVLLVDLTDRAVPGISFREVAPVRWETVRVDRLEDADSLDRLERAVESAWRASRSADPGPSGTEWMVRVVLEGPCPLWAELRAREDLGLLADELTELLGALDVALDIEGVHPVVSVEEHRSRADVLGTALRMAEEIRAGETTLSGIDAGDLVGVPSQDPAEVARYVRSLLEGADGEIAARLLDLPERA